jgi:hypothetical protein
MWGAASSALVHHMVLLFKDLSLSLTLEMHDASNGSSSTTTLFGFPFCQCPVHYAQYSLQRYDAWRCGDNTLTRRTSNSLLLEVAGTFFNLISIFKKAVID